VIVDEYISGKAQGETVGACDFFAEFSKLPNKKGSEGGS
jgi:hypothetical protein